MTENQPTPIIIKKYSSRRLYDTHNKRFISIRQLGETIRDSQDVMVIDKESGKDITKTILTQIIMEEEKANRNILPVDLLHQLIRSSGSMYKDALEDFLAKGAKTIRKARHDVESSLFNLSRHKSSKPPQPAIDELEQIKARLAELEASLARKDSSEK
ncbi:MAG: hypothetical protein DRH03_07080 [Deltaproteobacteria bacterium]|nr:MAG: hypothetical protein DRH03_07080 [Deltaproteobacteria bacterium]